MTTCNRTRTPAFLATLVLAAVIYSPAPAHASDGKVLPATVCQVWVPSNATAAEVTELRNSARYSVNGRVENFHPSKTLTVVCPLIHDTINAPLHWVRVSFRDKYAGNGYNNTGVLKCRIRSNDRFGEFEHDDFYRDSDEGDNDLDAQGDFEFLGLDTVEQDGNYTLTCVIPPFSAGGASSIGSIAVEEP